MVEMTYGKLFRRRRLRRRWNGALTPTNVVASSAGRPSCGPTTSTTSIITIHDIHYQALTKRYNRYPVGVVALSLLVGTGAAPELACSLLEYNRPHIRDPVPHLWPSSLVAVSCSIRSFRLPLLFLRYFVELWCCSYLY
ncbi:hypothetical protein GALMADRAFT_1246758 [Galerina marginata CBS 339.88]|uniref:Uncharacterized protein n=1 Tax=Galerina marginata (strain CBS 339.88) TaxID=685588 RepID=A0A067TBB6_GALM3|nr:hypothetical protein GALMADRAFT_1246758 [Galerina marginata CBS 339.88]